MRIREKENTAGKRYYNLYGMNCRIYYKYINDWKAIPPLFIYERIM